MIAGLHRYPVKSMSGEAVERLDVAPDGIVGDRVYALFDREDGSIVTARRTRAFPGLLDCAVAFRDEPEGGAPVPPVEITLPDGTLVASDDPDVDAVLSASFGRPVALRPTDAGGFVDCEPVSVITTATLVALGRACPESRFDARRFRMNVIVESAEAGFPENAWVGRELAFGEAVRLAAVSTDPRCVMVTLPVADLPGDPKVLQTIVEQNAVALGDSGSPKPCAGIYARVVRVGEIRLGDAISVV